MQELKEVSDKIIASAEEKQNYEARDSGTSEGSE